MDTADLTPAPLRHIGGLFPAVRRMPSPPPDAGMLYAALCADFPDSDSLDYLADLARGVNAPIRLFALSLLPPLLSAAGVTSAGCSLRRDANGRPFLLSRDGAALNADFSLSHSAAHVACFLWAGGGRVGVDVEEPVPEERARRLATRFLSEQERALLPEGGVSAGFTRIWTRREALCKQDGGGQPLRFDSAAPPPTYRLHPSACRTPARSCRSACRSECRLPERSAQSVKVPPRSVYRGTVIRRRTWATSCTAIHRSAT